MADAERVRREVVYTGRVQGVGFRATARSVAAGFAVTGWVRNEADGSVRLQVQGEPAEVERCLAGIRERLRHRINHEDGFEVPVVDGEQRFEIAG